MGSGLVAAAPTPLAVGAGRVSDAGDEPAAVREAAEAAMPAGADAGVLARRVAEAEALLATSGLELYREVLELLRAQLEAGKVNPVLASLLAQARSAMLRGLRQPERITRQAAPESPGLARRATAREGGTFDFAAFARLFEALAGGGAAGEDAAGADGPELALDPPRANA